MGTAELNLPVEDVVVVAYLLEKAAEEARGLTPLQVNKLVYICHGWTLGILGLPLIDNSSDQIQAWKYGPVVQKVYTLLKRFGRHEVSYQDFFELVGDFGIGTEVAKNIISDKLNRLVPKEGKVDIVLKAVWESYKNLTGGQLIGITHAKNTPWSKHVKKSIFGGVSHGVHIPDRTIKEYYRNELVEAQEK